MRQCGSIFLLENVNRIHISVSLLYQNIPYNVK